MSARRLPSWCCALLIVCSGGIGWAKTYEIGTSTSYNPWFPNQVIISASIPETDNGCALSAADWTIIYVVTTPLGPKDISHTWSDLLQQNAALMTVMTDTLQKKVFRVSIMPGEMPYTTKAKVEATYDCSQTQAPAPSTAALPSGKSPGDCALLTWCLDLDGDGVGDSNLKPILSCTKPDPFVLSCETNMFGGCTDGPKKIAQYVNGCGDYCPNDAANQTTKKWFWDGDLDNKGRNGAPLGSAYYDIACTPPAKPAAKGQWVNVGGDDCDTVSGLFITTTWYWDQDKDNHGAIASKISVCLKPKPKNNQGHWVLTGGDLCDGDGSSFKHENWYWDADLDGFAAETAPPKFGCKPGIPAPTGQWVKKKGDLCDDNKNPAHKKTTTQQEYYKDGDGDGVPNKKSPPKSFCTADEAKTAGYVPKQWKKPAPSGVTNPMWESEGMGLAEAYYAGNPDAQWDDCDANPDLTAFLVVYLDGDEDGYGGEEPMHLCKTPQPGALLSDVGGDCDDGNPAILQHATLYEDTDDDHFGDPLVPKEIDCTKEEYSQFLDTGWAERPDDLNPMVKAYTKLLNLAENAGKFFIPVTYDTATGEMNSTNKARCVYRHGPAIECLPAEIWSEFCPSLLNVPVRLDLQEYEIPVAPKPEFDLVADCLGTNAPYLVLTKFSTGNIMLERTFFVNFHPAGRYLIKEFGAGYAINLPFAVPHAPYNSEVYDWLAAYAIKDLAAIPGPVPVRYASDEVKAASADGETVQVLRRILYAGKFGPELQVNMPKPWHTYTGYHPGSLLYRPCIVADQAVANQPELQLADADGDYLPDPLETLLGTDLKSPDTDGDGDPDWFEYLWAERLPHYAVDGHARVSKDYPIIGGPYSFEEWKKMEDARKKAKWLLPLVLERLEHLYGDHPRVQINADGALGNLLIQHAQRATMWTVDAETGGQGGKSDLESAENPLGLLTMPDAFVPLQTPFLAASILGDALGTAWGCGPTGQDICISRQMLQAYSSDEIAMTLCHEVLHTLVAINGVDLKGAFEHQVINDVLGRDHFSYGMLSPY